MEQRGTRQQNHQKKSILALQKFKVISKNQLQTENQ